MSTNQTKSRIPFSRIFSCIFKPTTIQRKLCITTRGIWKPLNASSQEMDNLPFSGITKRTIEQFKAYLNSHDRKTAGAAAQKELKSGSIKPHANLLRRYLAYLIDMDTVTPIAPESIKLLRMENILKCRNWKS